MATENQENGEQWQLKKPKRNKPPQPGDGRNPNPPKPKSPGRGRPPTDDPKRPKQ